MASPMTLARRNATSVQGRVCVIGQSVGAATQTALVRAEVRAPGCDRCRTAAARGATRSWQRASEQRLGVADTSVQAWLARWRLTLEAGRLWVESAAAAQAGG
jgi:hypothetical protein